jgi:VanZ family protein
MMRWTTWIAQTSAGTRWLIWGLFLAAWSLALLTPHPVHVAKAILHSESSFYFAKGLHISAYAVLAILTGWLRVSAPERWVLLALLFLHALATEVLQSFVPERGPDLVDTARDHVGLLIGVLLSWRWWLPRKSHVAGADASGGG